jgi:peptide deformylase
MIRRVIEAGEPRLKLTNKQISNFKLARVKKLIKDLSDTMYKTDLIGIAAPQVGENWQIFVTHPRNTGARKLVRADKLRVFINPEIVQQSKIKSVIYEGCGSLGDVYGPVLRSKEITVEAFDQNGQKFSLCCDGILARVIQHEYDHLRQTEFIQKVSDYNKIVVKKYYRKNIRLSKMQIENSQTTTVEFKFI